MNKQLSIYLDFLRFFAAIVVLIAHISLRTFFHFVPDDIAIGQDAVIIFFVLSGYVIVFVANTKEKNLKDYFISRFARLYSVLIPALLLTLILDNIGFLVNRPFYGELIKTDILLPRLLAAFSFTNQIWFHDSSFLSNNPLWSLSYEFWYYILFASLFYIKGFKKWGFAIFACLIMGPKILILAPIWGLGGFTYYLNNKINLGSKKAAFLFFLSFVLIFGYIYIYQYVFHNPVLLGENYLRSRWYLANYFLGFFIALNIFSFKYIKSDLICLFEKPIRKFASTTFSIYLYHLPLLFFFGAIFRHKAGNLYTASLLIIFTLLSIYILAQFTEMKKHVFKKYITAIWNYFENKIHQFTIKIDEKAERLNNQNGSI